MFYTALEPDAAAHAAQARQHFLNYRGAQQAVRRFENDLAWQVHDDVEHLVRLGRNGERRAVLGIRSKRTETIAERYAEGKTQAVQQLDHLTSGLDRMQRLNIAHQVGGFSSRRSR